MNRSSCAREISIASPELPTDIQGLVSDGQFCELCADPQVCCNGSTPNGNIGVDPKFIGGASRTWTAAATYDPVTFQTTFTDGFASFDGLTDNFLNPDTAQVLQSLIVSNTPATITVWGDFADLGAVGKTYQINDYRLDSPNSPAIDAADNNAVTTCSADLDGNERFFDDPATPTTGNPPEEQVVVDMGAYEFGSPPPLDCNMNGTPDECDIFDCPAEIPGCGDCNENAIPDECDIASGTSKDENANRIPDECDIDCDDCPTDINGDMTTGPSDLATLLGCWGTFAHDSVCVCLDANDDDDIGPFDLASLLAAWGPCP